MGPDLSGRLKELSGIVKESELDAAIISSPRDIEYYTGIKLTGDAAFLIVNPKSKPLILISCLSNYARNLKTASIKFFSDFKDIVKEIDCYKTMGFDEKNTSAEFFLRLKKLGIKMKPFRSSIKKPRMFKDDWEIMQIKKAIKATEKIFKDVKIVGKTEQDITTWIDRRVIGMGLRNSFDPIIASGINSSYIHYLPGKRKIKAGDFVIMDIGVRANGYCSDLTRTFCRRPSKRQEKVYGDVLSIQKQVIDNARGGVGFDALEDFSKKLYEKMDYQRMHSIGHGIGMSVHERPVTGDTIKNGMVFTVEPGVYIKNWGGCRIEDMIQIKNNKARLLSTFTRDLTLR